MTASRHSSGRFFDLLQASAATYYFSAAVGHFLPRSLVTCSNCSSTWSSSSLRKVGSICDNHNNCCSTRRSDRRGSSSITTNRSTKRSSCDVRCSDRDSRAAGNGSGDHGTSTSNVKRSRSSSRSTVPWGSICFLKPSLSAALAPADAPAESGHLVYLCPAHVRRKGSLSRSSSRLTGGGGTLRNSELSVSSHDSWCRTISLGSRSSWNCRSSWDNSSSSGGAIAKRWKRYIPFRSSRIPKTRQPPPPAPPLFSASSASSATALQPSLQLAVAAAEDQAEEEEAAAAEAALQLSPWQAVRVLQAFLPPVPQSASPAAAAAARSLFPEEAGAAVRAAPGAAADVGSAATFEEEGQRAQHMHYATFDYFGQQQRDWEAARPQEEAAATAGGRAAAAAEAEARATDSSSTGQRGDTVRLSLNVAADLKRESVRGVCTLAHGVGSNVRLAVFCPDEEAPAMLALGADYAGVEALLPRVAKGWVGFDKALAVASVMPQLLKVARVLGPRKLMPSPKSGTVVTNLKEAVRAVKSGEAVEFRAEGENAEIKVVIGRTSFDAAQLLENIKCVVKDILKARPRSTGADQEEAAQAVAQAFVWPPPAFVERRQKLLVAKNLRPAIPELITASSRKRQRSSAESFIIAAHLSAAGTPSIPVHPVLLAPSSVGYYR